MLHTFFTGVEMATSSLEKITENNPFGLFFWGLLISIVSITLAWILLVHAVAYLPELSGFFPDLIENESVKADLSSFAELLNNSSALTGTIIGTSVAIASAFVAMMLASTATTIAKASLAESSLANKLNSPDYQSAKRWYECVTELSNLRTGFIYSYNSIKHVTKNSGNIVFKPSNVLLEKLEEILTNPSFNLFYHQCVLLRKDTEGDEYASGTEYGFQKAVNDLLNEVSLARQRDSLNSYYANIMFAFDNLLAELKRLDWTTYVTPANKELFMESLEKYRLIMFMYQDDVKQPDFSFDETVNNTISRIVLEVPELFSFGSESKLSVSMFPGRVKQLAEALNGDQNASFSLRKAQYRHHHAPYLNFDAATVYAANGDINVRENLIDKSILEARNLGYSPVVCNYISGAVDASSVAVQINEITANKQKPILILVVDGEYCFSTIQNARIFANAACRDVHQLIIIDGLTDSVANSSFIDANGSYDVQFESAMRVMEKPDSPSPYESEFNYGLGQEILSRNASLYGLFNHFQALPEAVGVVAIRYISLKALPLVEPGTIAFALAESPSELFVSGTITNIFRSTCGATDCATPSKFSKITVESISEDDDRVIG